MFVKNGTDATTTCVTTARAATGKRKVLVANGAYHGAVLWCSLRGVGVTDEDQAHLVHYEYNDLTSAQTAAAEAGDDLAAIIVCRFATTSAASRNWSIPRSPGACGRSPTARAPS
jgi:glutamate-1-semialdehyde 2,1-aminomutase